MLTEIFKLAMETGREEESSEFKPLVDLEEDGLHQTYSCSKHIITGPVKKV